MPDCPSCGTWNPDDKTVCWRCQTELPIPKEKKQRRQLRIGGLPVWAWVSLALILLAWMLTQCFVYSPVGVGG